MLLSVVNMKELSQFLSSWKGLVVMCKRQNGEKIESAENDRNDTMAWIGMRRGMQTYMPIQYGKGKKHNLCWWIDVYLRGLNWMHFARGHNVLLH